jgi:hypothetical protein
MVPTTSTFPPFSIPSWLLLVELPNRYICIRSLLQHSFSIRRKHVPLFYFTQYKVQWLTLKMPSLTWRLNPAEWSTKNARLITYVQLGRLELLDMSDLPSTLSNWLQELEKKTIATWGNFSTNVAPRFFNEDRDDKMLAEGLRGRRP